MYTLVVSVFLLILSLSSVSAQWTRCSRFKDPTSLNDLLAINGNIFAATANGIYISSNNGNTWNESSLMIYDVSSLATNGKYIFAVRKNAGKEFNGIYISSNDGETWEKTSFPDSLSVESIAANNKVVCVSTGKRIFHSTDNGKNWETIVLNQFTRCLVTSEENIYAGGSSGLFAASTNNGKDWSQYDIGLSNNTVNTIATIGQNILCATDRRVFITNNTILDWTVIEFDGVIRTFHFDKDKIFAGTDQGVIYSKDNGTTWINLGLSNERVHSLIIHDNILFAGAVEQGLWKLDLNSLTSVDEEQHNTQQFFTLDISPNPSDGKVHFSHNTDSAPISLEIFSMQGEKVFAHTMQQTSLSLDLDAIPAGMYYVIAKNGNNSTRQLLSLVK